MSTDERRPLLPPPAVQAQPGRAPEEETDPLLPNDAPSVPVARKLAGWTLLWYIVIWVSIIAGVAILMKALVDAKDVDFDFKKAMKRALGGGLSGAAAMVLQVLTLMPLRTVMNYQYRFGTTTTEAIRILYADGGFPRYYAGLGAALIQGPVSRFGDTAANVGILALLQSNPVLKSLPETLKTVFASIAAALFRMILTPVDTLKTTLQAQGQKGWGILGRRIKTYGLGTLWYGAWATAAATFVGHFPWFSTYNELDKHLPNAHSFLQKLGRQALMGFCASVVSDSVSNSLRVVKTYRQVNATRIGYLESARAVIATDGLRGLFGRGLKTRILANGLQGLMFSILWKLFLDLWDEKTKSHGLHA